jgi:hypothetical protein
MSNIRRPDSCRETLVVGKRFATFASIEAGPSASSFGWLRARLADLAGSLQSGHSLSVYEPSAGRMITIMTLEEFSEWASRHFPVAEFRIQTNA